MYKKIDTLKRARQSALRFLYTKSLTLCVKQFFMELFKLAEGGGHFYSQKTMFFALNVFGSMDRNKSDVPTEIFSQGLKKTLSREREKPLQIFRQGRKKPAKIQPFCWSRRDYQESVAAGKFCSNTESKSKRRWVLKRTRSSFKRGRRNTEK